ncbi:MAG: NADP-dependent phosphogluconate dehydrogenase [Acidobacteria bacterium]|nr:NADP-dependent phosphogluconate dehydrogenase [Acidobacteriota bacterium]
MGSALALNIEEHGFPIAVWNHEPDRTEVFASQNRQRRVLGAATLEEFAAALAPPRRILLMITAGAPVDQMIERLSPLLAPGDVLIDGGNSHFRDTARRQELLAGRGVDFLGLGVSGGEAGARRGPSLMAGGRREAYDTVRDVLEAIAAPTDRGTAAAWLGPGAAGHLVKMVHNGIEYGDLQAIAEAYDLLHRAGGLEAPQVGGIFADWDRGPLGSLLVEITARVLARLDDATGQPLVDMIVDEAGQKGTGRWTIELAAEMGVPAPTMTAAVDARLLSSLRAERIALSERLPGARANPPAPDRGRLAASVADALLASRVCALAQGFRLIRHAGTELGWAIDPRSVAGVWRAGCIIQSRVMDRLLAAYERDPELEHLFFDEDIAATLDQAQAGWRETVALAIAREIPVPAISASLAYYDAYRSARLPQNLLQAQRDYFGAHKYVRIDHPELGPVHTDWE